MMNDQPNTFEHPQPMAEHDAPADGLLHTPAQDHVEHSNTTADYGMIGQGISDSKDELKQIPVSFTVALPAVQLPLERIKDLHEGQSIDLNLDLTEDMSILINGKALGTGKLVQIGNKIGIQIKEWLTN